MARGGCGAYKVFWRMWEGGREEKVALVNKKNSHFSSTLEFGGLNNEAALKAHS
jgi:hypothetical protein